ncbi:iron complex transport system substrate-binding protein [Kribbella aluminosa]|uniref:Iron complex transport system substrate-binding protein n=1 Tax=Kribbella aluminosa TaxID=416017 RepID=A0ABS4UY83_9ACTN|nr:ABC transporter substrate-binding protein [Kribbella aluminosa]MBP2356590.1 iron complex transport system substrate-binding protein [Kribbella aluminosa]
MRIVSLLPSATEICFALGAGEDVVGVTFECDYPAAARTRRTVSTTTLPAELTPGEIDTAVRRKLAAGEDLYHLDADALRELDPDVVITQDLCAVCAIDVEDVDEALAYLGCTAEVVSADPHTVDEVLTSIRTIAKGIARDATPLLDALNSRLGSFRTAPGPRVALLEWTDPPFAPGHWLPEMVTLAGGTNVLGTAGQPSTEITWEDVTAARPDVIVAAPCGFDLDGAAQLTADLLPDLPADIPVWAVDANGYFARPGPRLVDGIDVLSAILHDATPAHALRLR